MQSILVGTTDGTFGCHEQNRSCMVKQKSLDGQEVPCIAVQPDNRNHVYAGTRAGDTSKVNKFEISILRSKDFGFRLYTGTATSYRAR